MGLSEVAKITVKDKNALELFEKVSETANNLDKMLLKLQSISDVGAQQLVFKEVLIKEIFDNICVSFEEQLRMKNIRISYEAELEESFISYPAMVKIIIENLVENAIYFAGVNDPFIKLKACQTHSHTIITIQDNGQGIHEKYQDRVFDMYFRGNERSKGNGLGLYIVKKAVEKLDGRITMESTLYKGSTFQIELPSKLN
jgi:signal transduction histidine kinase